MNNDGLTLNQLAERNAVLVSEVEKLRTEREQLAAENVGLKAAFSPEEIPAEAVDAFMDTAVMDHDWNDTSEWSWVENETEVIRAVLDALKPETPATDRIVAGIKADALPDNIAEIIDSGDLETICYESERSYAEDFRLALYNFRQLRGGAK
ncbi:hypothetical protein FVB40_13725 [Raoultella ornithinolytica]|uniref:hypothetical protein n=1 Tax=Raoultella ornithinolytica TaxID=54291 RepID=UPI000B5A84E5|nr:hypothetical protein [Raoultella ornithinolytica]MTF10098.1 hypothetical protein [Raoultella ornithinolytica]OWY87714.1 hypothetical protein CAC00_11915 [Raoultella ornithinolytica]